MANDNHKIATRARVTPLASTTIVTLNSTKANSDASDSDEHSQHKEGEASSQPWHGHLSPINSGYSPHKQHPFGAAPPPGLSKERFSTSAF